jgi:hypothetical protein
MDTSVSRIVMWGSAFAITLVSGVVLSNLGKPLNSLIFTIHKLIAIGTVILLSGVDRLRSAAQPGLWCAAQP